MADEKMVTEREAVLRERKAIEWCAAYLWGRSYFRADALPKGFDEIADDLEIQVGRAYPLPVKKRPLRIRLSDGNVWHRPVPDGRFWCWEGELIGCVYSLGDLVARISATPDDLRLLARCLDGELEDVPEGEE